ncbi:MAG: ATP-grasp domain-containing protein [Saprospiraceae bacterium]|nr:ATP-grasp domain-containing protein [Saprospiraceae bacterium]
MKILVTNGAYKHTLALVRSLGAAGHEVGVVAHRRAVVSFFSRYCRHKHIIDTTDKQLFVDAILAILQKENYDIVLPVGLSTIVWLAERGDEIRQFTHLPIAEFDKITLFESKKATYDLSVKLNIPTPLSFFPKDRTDADICAAQLKPPIVVKHCTRSGRDWLKYAQTADEAVWLFEAMRQLAIEKNVRETFEVSLTWENTQNTEGGTILLQEYLSGGGYGFFGLYDKGIFKQGFAHKRIREFPVSGGASACAESIEDETLTVLGRRILDAVSWHGLAMVEFKKDEAGQFRLLEVNPKLWGSFDLSVASGVPFAEKWVQLALNQSIEPHQDYEKGIQFSWLMEGDVQHGWETGELEKILRAVIFDKKTHTNLTWRDPLASLFLIFSGFKTRVLFFERAESKCVA